MTELDELITGPGDDDDSVADDWEAMLDGEGGEGGEEEDDDLAAEWESMMDGEDDSGGGETTRVLNQDEIDSLLGFDDDGDDMGEQSGIQAILNSAMVSYERLP
ncbi:MAG: flagellar motor switch protein FliM, partial [Rhodospirillales bacterium]